MINLNNIYISLNDKLKDSSYTYIEKICDFYNFLYKAKVSKNLINVNIEFKFLFKIFTKHLLQCFYFYNSLQNEDI